MRRLLLGMPVFALLVLMGAAPAPAADRSVSIVDNSFSPFDVTIGVGDTVTWRHTGQRPHSVQADDGAFNSSPGCSFQNTGPCMHNGSSFSFTATRSGTFFYHCAVHGSTNGTGMAGTVTVASSSTSSTAGATTTTTRPRTTTTTTRPTTTTTAAGATTTTAAAGATTTRPPDQPLQTIAPDPDAATSTTVPLAPVSSLAVPAGEDDDDGPPLAIVIGLVVLAAALAAVAVFYRPMRRS